MHIVYLIRILQKLWLLFFGLFWILLLFVFIIIKQYENCVSTDKLRTGVHIGWGGHCTNDQSTAVVMSYFFAVTVHRFSIRLYSFVCEREGGAFKSFTKLKVCTSLTGILSLAGNAVLVDKWQDKLIFGVIRTCLTWFTSDRRVTRPQVTCPAALAWLIFGWQVLSEREWKRETDIAWEWKTQIIHKLLLLLRWVQRVGMVKYNFIMDAGNCVLVGATKITTYKHCHSECRR